MMGIEEIKFMNDKKYIEAKKNNIEPFVFSSQEQIDNIKSFPFKHIGNYCPKGWIATQEFFVDLSGLGSEGEMALTIKQFRAKLKVGFGYALCEIGEFQVRVMEFVRC